MYPPQQPPAPPRPRKRKNNTLLIVLVSIMGVLVLCIGVAAVWGVTHQDKPADTQQQPSAPAANPSEARPGVDVGAGTPNAPCASNRQGYFFVKDGKTYVCKGPEPYRWRE